MSLFFRLSSIAAFITTLPTLIARAGVVVPLLEFVARHSTSFYVAAVALMAYSLIKNLWFVLIVVVTVLVAALMIGLGGF